jgi:hypothetical protein
MPDDRWMRLDEFGDPTTDVRRGRLAGRDDIILPRAVAEALLSCAECERAEWLHAPATCGCETCNLIVAARSLIGAAVVGEARE